MAAARAEKREAGRARRGPELRPALLEPAREQAEAEAEGGGGGRPGARRAREAVSAQPGRSGGETSSSCPARRASVLLSRPLSFTLSLPGWKFPLTSREQTDGRTHARAQRGREVGSPPPGVGEARAPRPGAPSPEPRGCRDAPGRHPNGPRVGPNSWRPPETGLVPTCPGTKVNPVCMVPPLGVSVTLRSLCRLNRNFKIVADVSPENYEFMLGLGEVFNLVGSSTHRTLSGQCDPCCGWNYSDSGTRSVGLQLINPYPAQGRLFFWRGLPLMTFASI